MNQVRVSVDESVPNNACSPTPDSCLGNLKIALWQGRPSGPDPRSHLWFETHQGLSARICDGTSWLNVPEDDAEIGVEPLCAACKDMFAADSLRGKQAFQLSPQPAAYRGYPLYNEGTPCREQIAMPTISMLTFARFYVARKERQQRKVVHDFYEQSMNPELISYRDYYRPLRDAIRKYHWQTGDLTAFEEILPFIPQNPKYASRRQQIQTVGEAYSQFWRRQNFQHINAAKVDLPLADIQIRINPELGVRSVTGDEYVVKMWFSAPEISRQLREVMSFLMGKAQISGAWPGSHLRIWDIRRQQFLPTINSPYPPDVIYETKARLFSEIWATLTA